MRAALALAAVVVAIAATFVPLWWWALAGMSENVGEAWILSACGAWALAVVAVIEASDY